MKKIIPILLPLCLLFSLAACGKAAPTEPMEPTEPDITQEAVPETVVEPAPEIWYGRVGLSELCLVLSHDGSYTLTVAGQEQAGTWTTNGGDIFLDGEETASLFRLGSALSFPEAGIALTAEEPELGTYTPAELMADAPGELLNGYWKSLYVESGGVLLFASQIGDRTDLYVESLQAVLGGPLFGDVLVDMTEQDGALTCTKDGCTITLALQQDGLLRLTLTTQDGDITVYCLRTYAAGIDPAPEG